MKRPVIIICYARSGGTILNKCLSSFTNTVVMSEVHPLGGGTGKKGAKVLNNIKDQAREWYGINLQSSTFSDMASELNAYCLEREEYLIIRDWSIVDFEPLPENNLEPLNAFSTLRELAHLNPIVIGFVRDSIDVWISRGQPDIDDFFTAYNNYILALKDLNIPIFSYDDFTKNPQMVLRQMCDAIELPFQDVLETAISYDKVNGDIQKGSNSRGQKMSSIRPMKRQIIPLEKIKRLNSSGLMKRVNSELNYGTNYFDKVSYVTYIAKRIGQFYYRQKRKLE